MPAVPAQSGEDPKQRVDRELLELLNELRVALPGVQVLFAFLLILPFNEGWQRINELERYVYFATLMVTAAATALLVAPSSYHRLRFRAGAPAKERMLLTSNRLAIAGIGLVGLAIAGTVFLVTEVLFGLAAAIIVALLTLSWFGAFWYGLPLLHRRRDPGDDGER
jgi:hypothetical protein